MSDSDPFRAEASTAPVSLPQRRDQDLSLFAESDSYEEEYAAFYRRFTPTLVGFLMWQGASASLAADLAQETMIKAYRGWLQIERPEAWARTVASRELVRHVSRVEEELSDPDLDVARSLVPRQDELAEWEQHFELSRLLDCLPPRQRQVLAWSVDGYSPSEIAACLGVDPGVVRVNLHKARRAVAERLGGKTREN